MISIWKLLRYFMAIYETIAFSVHYFTFLISRSVCRGFASLPHVPPKESFFGETFEWSVEGFPEYTRESSDTPRAPSEEDLLNPGFLDPRFRVRGISLRRGKLVFHKADLKANARR